MAAAAVFDAVAAAAGELAAVAGGSEEGEPNGGMAVGRGPCVARCGGAMRVLKGLSKADLWRIILRSRKRSFF